MPFRRSNYGGPSRDTGRTWDEILRTLVIITRDTPLELFDRISTFLSRRRDADPKYLSPLFHQAATTTGISRRASRSSAIDPDCRQPVCGRQSGSRCGTCQRFPPAHLSGGRRMTAGLRNVPVLADAAAEIRLLARLEGALIDIRIPYARRFAPLVLKQLVDNLPLSSTAAVRKLSPTRRAVRQSFVGDAPEGLYRALSRDRESGCEGNRSQTNRQARFSSRLP